MNTNNLEGMEQRQERERLDKQRDEENAKKIIGDVPDEKDVIKVNGAVLTAGTWVLVIDAQGRVLSHHRAGPVPGGHAEMGV
jgi:hypothetical protein